MLHLWVRLHGAAAWYLRVVASPQLLVHYRMYGFLSPSECASCAAGSGSSSNTFLLQDPLYSCVCLALLANLRCIVVIER